jgi:HEAT repeat protein
MMAQRDRTPSRGARKLEALALLGRRDLDGVRAWAGRDPGASEVLTMLLYVRDDTLRYRALEALGVVAGVMAGRDLTAVRERLRRILWSMNHESGNVPWHAPEAAGEILANVPELADEFARLVAAFINLEPFVHGVHRALARVAEARPGAVAYLAPYLEHALESADAVIRAHAAVALAHVDPEGSRGRLVALLDDSDTLLAYDRSSGTAGRVPVGRFVREHLGLSGLLPSGA